MTAKRGADFSLDAALADPGFTPRASDREALLDRAAGDDGALAAAARRAIGRLGVVALGAVSARLRAAPGVVLAELGADLASRPDAPAAEVREVVTALAGVATESAHVRTRRGAVVALGRILAARDAEVVGEGATRSAEDAIAQALEADDAGLRRAAARALAAAGTPRAAALSARLDPGQDATATRALRATRRDAMRPAEPGRADLDRAPPAPLEAVLACRRGLEEIVRRQLGDELAPRVLSPGRVAVTMSWAPSAALATARAALGVAFPLPPASLAGVSPADVARAVGASLASAQSRRILETFGPEDRRLRVSFVDGGKHRELAWAIGEQIELQTAGWLRDDPRQAPWEVSVGLPPAEPAPRRGAPFVTLELRPRCPDARFPWRVAEVPAASHPTVAAAIAHLGGTRADDVVWDPFVGSGGELCERARLGPLRELVGTDVDDVALAAARRNLDAAGVRAALIRADARTFVPTPPATLVLSNPPMGRRVLRHEGDVRRLLSDVIRRAPATLAPQGRWVWASAHPRETREAARAVGLTLATSHVVDMGGFEVELQRFERGSSRS